MQVMSTLVRACARWSAVAFAGALTATAGCALAQPHPSGHHRAAAEPMLEAVGDGSVSETPDTALASVAVVTEAPTAREAMTRNAELAQKVVAALRAIGLAGPDAIRTQAVSVSPVTEGRPGERTRIVGHRAANQVEIRVGRIADLGGALDAALAAGATDIGSTRLVLANPRPAELQALAAAVLDAQARLEAMASALGRRVGRILEVRTVDGGGRPEPLMTYARASSASIPIEAGQITVRARVVLRAELQ
jgi:uncharacterized protein YggE